MSVKDFRVQVIVKNNRLLSAIEKCGHTSVNEFCKFYEIPPGAVYNLINLKEGPVTDNGGLRMWVPEIITATGCLVEDIFSQDQMYMEIKTNRFTAEITAKEMAQIAGYGAYSIVDQFERVALSGYVEESLGLLRESDRKVIEMRFGIGSGHESSLSQVADSLGKTKESIRRREGKALRKLREEKNFPAIHEYQGSCQ